MSYFDLVSESLTRLENKKAMFCPLVSHDCQFVFKELQSSLGGHNYEA